MFLHIATYRGAGGGISPTSFTKAAGRELRRRKCVTQRPGGQAAVLDQNWAAGVILPVVLVLGHCLVHGR